MSNTIPPPPPGFVMQPQQRRSPAPPPGFVLQEPDDTVLPGPSVPNLPPPGARNDPSILPAIAQGATFGFSDEMAGLARGGARALQSPSGGSLIGAAVGGARPGQQIQPDNFGAAYEEERDISRQRLADLRENRPIASTAAEIAGAVGSGVGLLGSGLSLSANAIRAGQGLGRVAGASAVEGAALGGISGAGTGEGAEGRLRGAAAGIGIGAGLGAITPFAVSGAQAAAQPFIAPVMSRLRPDAYANRALSQAMQRGGIMADDVVQSLQRARADGQDGFAVADAMGNSGQRLLSAIARTPNDARQMVSETLQQRQMGQSERLSAALADGFAAPDTAAQRTTGLTAERSAAASANYGAAREGAGMVDPTAAIQAADDFLQPGASRLLAPQTNIADDSIESAVRRARGYLTDGQSVITDFSAALRSKQELDAMIERAQPAVQRQLIPIRNALDTALEGASPDYANARNVFRQQSRAIDAVETGTQAASGRTRASDNILAFEGMTAPEQSAFRAGYADPYIARVESSSISPTTNRARMLMTEKTGQEFPAFAAPGMGEQLGRRITREQRMFETANAALGGSKTADNLADIAEAGKFDPSIMAGLLTAPVRTAANMVGQVLSEAQGMSPGVMQRVANMLLETRPDVASEIMLGATRRTARSDKQRALANVLLNSAIAAP